MANYIAIVHKDEDSDYGVSFADFPGCFSAGSTLEEAKSLARDALIGHIQVSRERGYAIPAPMTLEDARALEAAEDATAFIVISVPYEPDPIVLVRLTEAELHQLDEAAGALGMQREAFMAQILREALARRAGRLC